MNKINQYFDDVKSLKNEDVYHINRVYLHKEDKRMCVSCKTIFQGIKENFHIKRYYENRTKIAYNTLCNGCQSTRNLNHRLEIRKTPEKYIKSLVVSIKHRAKNEDVPFNLDKEFLMNLLIEQDYKCPYTGEPISFDYYNANRKSPHRLMGSLDRIVPKDGYIKNNVVWTLYYINRSKNDLTHTEFISLCKTISDKFDPIPAKTLGTTIICA